MSSKTLWLLCLAGCALPVAPTAVYQIQPTPMIVAGRVLAMLCGAAEGLRQVQAYNHLRFWLDPDTMLAGYTRGRNVYVQERLAAYTVLWAHEQLHALYGLPGSTVNDHPVAFWHCGLDARQF